MKHALRLDELVVGRRVVVRHRLPDGSASDALGELVAADEERLVVVTRRGEVVVPRADVLAAKAVPPAPARRQTSQTSIEELELVAAEHWRPVEREDLGAWRLRAAGGFTGRANSALAIGDPGCDLDTALARVRAFYAARHLDAMIAAPTGPLTQELELRGWQVRTPSLVMTARLDPPLPAQASPVGLRLDDEPDDVWLATYRGRGPVGEVGRRVLLSADEQVFASIRDDDGEVLAVARGSLSRGTPLGAEGTWLGLSAVETAPAHRRRGLAVAVTRALLAWGAQRGAARAFLQVAVVNDPARALYEKVGFRVHHEYRYLVG
ncbi:FR47-like protein [Quadrisphaera granulorum]|uniref:FR47-like protein n=1 Tax=Quadrisphaera granulorum TaxID=317664 RepID=A0A316A5J7_9ACTN|nr:GNAT family N-acetyltransferase [Quadrisphaera granulorum]PWJ52965.1 FR47-like protein [Quadrisphaera granulorum]SZE97347.1 FR47-like protein [Quadrisphaera granulorum]